MNINRLISCIDKYPIISFDIFDTLVKRDVINPTDVFDIVEKEYNKKHNINPWFDFKRTRIKVEAEVRSKADTEDITLDAIYTTLPYDEIVSAELKELELRTEKQVIVVNKPMKTVYDYAVSQNKKIIVVSEMYLPVQFLKSILKDLGYEKIYAFYVSSEIGSMKKSGNLFRYAIKDMNVAASDILHIGDAKRSDWVMPRVVGMKSCPIMRHYNNTIYYNCTKDSKIDIANLHNFINNHLEGSRLYRIGYETLGPLLYGFCTWLHQQAQDSGLRRLLFLARDARIMQQAYDIIYPDEKTFYVYSSRRALTVPLLHFAKTWHEALGIIPHATYIDISSLLARLGLNTEKYENRITSVGLSLNAKYTLDELRTDKKFEEVYNILSEDINTNSREEYNSLKRYLEGLGITGKEGIVDLGWKGTIQKCMERLSEKMGLDVHYEGFYVGIFLKQQNAHGYVFDASRQEDMLYIRCATGLMESFFCSDHGSLLMFGDKGPEFSPYEYEINETLKQDLSKLREIQAGALTFVKEYATSIVSDNMKTMDKDVAFHGLKQLFSKPQKEENETLGNLSFYDTEVHYLAKPLLADYYSVKSFKRNFADSHWKIGYLKRMLKLPLPYMSIYRILRHLGKQS